jgi:hypothetical protein
MAYIRVKRGKFKVEINKKGYPRVFKSFSTIKDAKKFCKDVESQMERQIFEDYSGARGITLKEILVKYRDEKTVLKKGKIPLNIDIDKFLDEKEEFELGGDPDVKLKRQRMQDNILSGALQKIDMAMSGIMSTLNLAGGGKVVDLNQYRKDKQPVKPKQINLADYFKVGVAIADLNESERSLVNDLLKRTLGKNPK